MHAVGAIIIEQRERGEASSYFCQSNLLSADVTIAIVDICMGHMYIYSDSEFKKSLIQNPNTRTQVFNFYPRVYIGAIAPLRKSFGFE